MKPIHISKEHTKDCICLFTNEGAAKMTQSVQGAIPNTKHIHKEVKGSRIRHPKIRLFGMWVVFERL